MSDVSALSGLHSEASACSHNAPVISDNAR